MLFSGITIYYLCFMLFSAINMYYLCFMLFSGINMYYLCFVLFSGINIYYLCFILFSGLNRCALYGSFLKNIYVFLLQIFGLFLCLCVFHNSYMGFVMLFCEEVSFFGINTACFVLVLGSGGPGLFLLLAPSG